MQRTPSGPSVPTNVAANGASADARAVGAPSRYDEAGLREQRRLADLGLASTRTPVVRGRDAALASIGVQLDRVRSGVGAVVLVEGEPGMGKTRLLAEADRVAARLAFRVGAGAAEPGAGVVELAPLMAALFDGSRPLLDRSGLPELRSLPEQRYWLLQDLEMLLERAALDGPLLISLDDLQWADSGTAAALLALSVRLADLPVAWVLAYRPNQGSAQVVSAIEQLDQSGAERIVLGPLDEAAVAQVAEDVIDAEPDDVLLDLVKGAHGSPFVLIELLSGLRDEDLIRVVAGRAELVEARLPRRVAFTMRERLRSVTPPAREAATVAASLGRRFSFTDLARMLDRFPATLLGPVEELIDSGVLVESGDRLAFRHDVTREAVRESVPVSARRALDRQAADVLLGAGAAPVEVAAQIAASAEPGDEQAISILLRAADALATTDPGAGADLSRRALELAPRDHHLRGSLLAQSAVLLHSAGRVDEARAFADTQLRDALPVEQEAEVLLGIAGMFRVPPDARVAAGRQALALPELPAHLRAQHLAGLFHNLLVGGRIEEAKAIRAETTAAVKASGDANSAFALALADTVIAYADGRYGDALDLTEQAASAGIGTTDWARTHLGREWRCETRTVLDRIDDSLRLAADGIAAAQRDRNAWAVRIFEIWRGRQLHQLGRLADAGAILEGQFPPETGDRFIGALDAAGLVALGRVALHQGNGRLQQRTAQLARALLEDTTPNYRREAVWLLALLAMASGDPGAAHASLCALGEEERTSILPLFPIDVTDEIPLARIALAAGDDELAQVAAAQADRRAQLNPRVATILATAAHVRGLVTSNIEDLERAVKLFATAPRPIVRAYALEDLGAARARAGAADAAIEAFDGALALFAEAGAAWDMGRVRGRLRDHGIRRRLVPRERAETGWEAMTDSELAVARLVAQGLTNREVAEQLFVSPHTVSSHLRSIFAKLEINSRLALARIAADHDQDA
ncbi:MAG: AAA family ATPase [Solirubrobacteraceae bacterium]|jgi:DNA-binding CsgD family transcriptional regulator